MEPEESAPRRAFRLLPSVDEVLREARVAALAGRVPRPLVAGLVQAVLEGWRAEIGEGTLDERALRARIDAGDLAAEVEDRVRREQTLGVRPAVNATGVVLHSGLGRAPLHPLVAERMAAAARGYCVLEVDRDTGRRGSRDARSAELACRLCGAEAALVVNNNAAAVMLVLAALARDREVVLSRGELVEIGGSFRVPDVMAAAGARLVEVGTTNRTRLADYAAVIGSDTALLMKVHTSNFRIVGFTEEVDAASLARLSRDRGLASAWDLGSGRIEAGATRSLDGLGEPTVAEALASGVDLVTFSGDKLLGGPQAGFVVGSRERIESLRAHAIYRALRLDKVTLAGVEATLELYLAGRADELPARALLVADPAELEVRARRLARTLGGLPALRAGVVASTSQPGSGAAPGIELETFAVRLSHRELGADALAAALRKAEPPVFARVHEGACLLDVRTLTDADAEALRSACASLGASATAMLDD